MLGGHNVAHFLHEVTEPLDLLAVTEALAEDQVEVALQGVPKARGVGVTVPDDTKHTRVEGRVSGGSVSQRA